MGQKPKTRRPAQKTRDVEKQKEQSARFIKAAQEIGVDETGMDFERAIKRISGRSRSRAGAPDDAS